MKRLFLFFVLLFSVPVVLTPVLPMQDLPSHVAAVSIYSRLESGSALLGEYFQKQSPWRPYNSFYITGILLAPVANPEVAARLFVLGVLWLYGYILWRIARRTGSSFPLLALPFFFNITYYGGMANFLLGLPLFLALAHMMWNSPGRFSTVGWFASFLILQALIFLIHPVAYALFLVLAGLILAWRFLTGLSVIRPFLAGLFVPLVAASTWIHFGFLKGRYAGGAGGNIAGDFHIGSLLSSTISAEWRPGQLGINQLIDTVLLPFGPHQQIIQGIVLVLLLAVSAVVLNLAAKARRAEAGNEPVTGSEGSPRAGAGLALWAVFVFAVLLLPFSLFNVTYVSTRSLTFALPLLVVLKKPSQTLARARLVRFLVLIFLCVSAGNLVVQHFGYSEEARGGVALAREVPDGDRLLGLVVSGKSAWISTVLDPFIHIHHLHAAESGGFVSSYPVQPLFVVTPIRASGPPFPRPYEPGAFSWERHGVHYDRILVRMSREHARTTAVGRRLGSELIPRTDIVAGDGDWLLLKPKTGLFPDG